MLYFTQKIKFYFIIWVKYNTFFPFFSLKILFRNFATVFLLLVGFNWGTLSLFFGVWCCFLSFTMSVGMVSHDLWICPLELPEAKFSHASPSWWSPCTSTGSVQLLDIMMGKYLSYFVSTKQKIQYKWTLQEFSDWNYVLCKYVLLKYLDTYI